MPKAICQPFLTKLHFSDRKMNSRYSKYECVELEVTLCKNKSKGRVSAKVVS